MRGRGTEILGIVLASGGIAGATLLFGCASGMSGPDVIAPDAAARADAAARDAGAAEDGSPLGPDDAGPSVGDAGGTPAAFESDRAAGCFDFVDSDTDGMVDCDDMECSVTPLCCVGSSAGGCCTAVGAARPYPFDGCAPGGSTAITDCFPGVDVFGSPLPELREAGVAPLGDDRYDSGVVLDEIVDPRVAVVHVTARISTSAGAACDGCIDFVAVGLVSGAQTLGASTRVSPDAAVVVNAARSEVRLLIGDAMIGSWPFSALGGATETTYELIASPEGTLSLRAGTMPLATGVPWAPAGPARVVVYGRAANPGGATMPTGTALGSISVSSEICDAPASIERGAAPILPSVDAFWTATDQPTGASVVGDDMLFAFEGRIHRATATASMDGRFRAAADPHDSGNAVLTEDQTVPWRSVAVGEPELVVDGGARRIYFTATGEGGRTVIGRADETAPWVFDSVVQLYPAPTSSDTASYDGPTYLDATIGGAARSFLAIRRRTDEGGEIVLLDLTSDADSPSRASASTDPAFGFSEDGTGAAGFVHRAGRTATAFDADEVAAPGLVYYDGLLRLYFAGRRGTRWAIGMLASSDGQYWHLVEDGRAILGGSGAGFDAISVGEPEPVHVGGELRLYYTAHDGARRTIGMGRHLVTEVAP